MIDDNVKLVLATHNQGKVTELGNILSDALWYDVSAQVVSAAFLGLDDPVEDGATFEENALIKARFVCENTGLPAIADDSGLIVNFLGNAPGIISARWSGKHGDDIANNELLLRQLEDLPESLRKAHFVTCCALCVPNTSSSKEVLKTGSMEGKIINEMRGENGFGYDCIFVPDAYSDDVNLSNLTSAQLTSEQKNAISHRGKAIRSMIPELIELFDPPSVILTQA